MANYPLPVARSKISIGGPTGTYTQTALVGDTYALIGGVRSVPGFGDTVQDITVEEVNDGRTRHAKGTRNGQTMEIVCSRRSGDAGQIAISEAADSDQTYNLKIELPNGNDGVDTYYMPVLVMQKPFGLGGPNDTQTVTYTVMPQEAPIEVLAS